MLPFAPGRTRSIVMSVCLSVCLSVRLYNWKTTQSNFTKFLCALPVAMSQSFSDGVAICYVYTSGFVDDVTFLYHGTNETVSSTTLYFEDVCQVAVPAGRQATTVYCVWWNSSECGTRGEVCSVRLSLRRMMWLNSACYPFVVDKSSTSFNWLGSVQSNPISFDGRRQSSLPAS